METTK